MVGVVGINLNIIMQHRGLKALAYAGNNMGNMLFTRAVLNQVKNAVNIGFGFDPDEVNETYEAVVVPAANWVNAKEDWSALTERLEKLELPISVIGLGAQADVADAIAVHEGTRRFLDLIAERCRVIGVRGEFTRQTLARYGVTNVSVIGCPSLFLNLAPPEVRRRDLGPGSRVAFSGTRYGVSAEYLKGWNVQRELMRYGFARGSSLYYQSEACEIGLLCHEVGWDSREAQFLLEYYGEADPAKFRDTLFTKGKFHTSVLQWIEDIKREDLFVSSRIHGVIAALVSGVPAMLVAHDTRTREMAESMRIPCFDEGLDMADAIRHADRYLSDEVLDAFNANAELLYGKLKGFYADNGVEAKLP